MAEAEFAADFTPGVTTDFVAFDHVWGRDLLGGEEWVYLRWEPGEQSH